MGQCMVRSDTKDLVLPPPDLNKSFFLTHRVGNTTDDWQAGARGAHLSTFLTSPPSKLTM